MSENYSIKAQLDASGFRSGINDIKSDLSSLDSHAMKVGSAIGNALKVGVLAGGAAIAGGLAAGTKAFGDYEQGVADLNKVMGGTPEMQKSVANGMRELSTQSGTAITSLLGVGSSLSALGIGSGDVVQATKVVDQMGIALGLGNEEAASYLAGMNTLYGTSVNQWSNLASGINEVENSTAATSAGMLNFANEFAPVAKLMGVTDKQALALGATFEALKVPPAEAATSIRSALSYAMNGPDMKMDETTKAQIQAGADQVKKQYKDAGKSAAEATAAAKEYSDAQKIAWSAANPGNDRMNSWAKLLGVDVKTLNQMLDSDLNGTLLKTGAELGKIESGTKRMDLTNTIFGTYGQKSIALLGDQTGAYTENLNTLNRGFEENVSIGKEVETRNNTLYGSWNKVKTGLNDIGITVGEATSGPLKGFMDWFVEVRPMVGDFIKSFLEGDWDAINDKFSGIKDAAIKAFKTIAGAAGVGLVAIGLAKIAPIALTAGRAFVTMAASAVLSFARMTAASVISSLSMVATWAASTGRAFISMAAVAVSSFLTTTGSIVSGYATQTAAAITARLAFLSTWAAAAAPLAGIAAGIAVVAAGLAALGFALDPGKFTIFGGIASDTFNGLKSVISDCWKALQEGDFSGIANRLKTAMQDAWNYAKNIDWKGLGSEIVTMIGDGAKALIKTVLDIGDWIYKSASDWVSSGGPRQLGYDIADAIGNAIKSLISGDFDFWGAIKGAFSTISSWLSLGWEIAKGIGSGLLDRIKQAVQPVANSMLATLATAGYEIQGVFARTWNTVLLGVTNVVAGIYTLFEGVGTTIVGYLQPAIDAIQKLTSYSSGSNSGLYLSDTGAIVKAADVEAYRKKHDGKVNLTPYTPASNSPYNQNTVEVGGSYNPSISVPANMPADQKAAYAKVMDSQEYAPGCAGYRTGGKGFTASEMQGYGSGTLTATTDRGDLMTLSGKEQILERFFTKMERFTADYQTNSAAAGQAFADKIFPAANNISVKSEIAGTTTINAANVAANLTTDSIKTTTLNFKQGVGGAADGFFNTTTAAAQAVAASTQSAAQNAASTQIVASGYAATALRLGAEVGAKFTTDGGNAVKISMVNGGTALIGSIGQGSSNFVNATNQGANISMNAAAQSGSVLTSSTEKSAANLTSGASSVSNSATQLGGAGAKAANDFAVGIGSAAGGFATAIGTLLGGTMRNFFSGGGAVGGASNVKIGAGKSTINANGATINADGTADYETMTCMGDTVLVNALKFTDRNGNITYSNPLAGDPWGTQSGSGTTTIRSGGSSSYSSGGYVAAAGSPWAGVSTSPTGHGAKGYFANRGAELIGVGEMGPELVLPSDITAEIVAMVNARKGGGSGNPAIINLYMNSKKVGEAFVSDIRQSGSLSMR